MLTKETFTCYECAAVLLLYSNAFVILQLLLVAYNFVLSLAAFEPRS